MRLVNTKVISESLCLQKLPFKEADIPYIQNILDIINDAEKSLQAYPYLNFETPITVVDKELIR